MRVEKIKKEYRDYVAFCTNLAESINPTRFNLSKRVYQDKPPARLLAATPSLV